MFKNNKTIKQGFTLAETLITLGIIGVVAAITLPTLVQKYRSYVLHQQFLKSYSALSQAVLQMKAETGDENLKQKYATYDPVAERYPNANEFYKEFDKYMKVVKVVPRYSIQNYTATAVNDKNDWGYRPVYVLPDGSSYGRLVNGSVIAFIIDANGPDQGPNRYGFDVFEFRIMDKTDMVRPLKTSKRYTEEELENQPYPDLAGWPCDKTSKQVLNGMGCAWYALNDINPDDETQKYWNNLPW